jgi:DNA-directed RNA polymerase omega subunit
LEDDVEKVISNEAPDSKFAYVVVVSRRARQLMIGARPLVENPHSRKNTRIAEEELRAGVLEFEAPVQPNAETADAEAKRRKA